MMLFLLVVCLLLLLLSLLAVVELVSAAFSCTSHGVLHGDVGGVLYWYTGALEINGPDEGLLIIYSIYEATSIVGSTAGTQPNILFPLLNNNHVLVLFTVICATVQCFFSGTLILARVDATMITLNGSNTCNVNKLNTLHSAVL